MSRFDFILAGISGAIEPVGTGRLSGCTGSRRTSADPAHTAPNAPDFSRGRNPCPEPDSPV